MIRDIEHWELCVCSSVLSRVKRCLTAQNSNRIFLIFHTVTANQTCLQLRLSVWLPASPYWGADAGYFGSKF